MPVKISINTVAMLKDLPAIQDQFNADLEETLAPELIRTIKGGTSPVRGEGRFDDYSDSYKDTITRDEGVIKGTDGGYWTGKKLRPVNLFVSGAALGTLLVKTAGKVLKVSFSSKILKYHNDGAGHNPRRAVLPDWPGAKFSTTVTRFIVGRAKVYVDRVLKNK